MLARKFDTGHSTMKSSLAFLLFLPLMVLADPAPTARETGLMEGSPPPADKVVNFENFILPPYNRWGLMHLREVVPTRAAAASGTPSLMPQKPQDLSALEIQFPGGRVKGLLDWLEEAYTDGLIVLHEGQVVYERYFNDHNPDQQHLMFSVTKSVTGTLLLMLAEKGMVDTEKMVSEYLPELMGTSFGDATVQQILDMSNSIHFNEDYTDPDAEIAGYLAAMQPDGEGLWAYLQTLTRKDRKFEHGEAFHYVTPDPDVLGFIIRRQTGKTLAQVLQDLIWSRLGASQDAYYWLDYHGIEMAGGGLAITLRDAARFGQMILQDGHYNGAQIIPKSVALRIREKRNHDIFSEYYKDDWYGMIADSYHDQWWGYTGVNAVAALGVHGQFIYINSDAGVVIARQSSEPDAESERIDVETAIVMHAISAHLASQTVVQEQ
jgi:CubicO group peptidase (beta-lactamase class C family)